MILVTGVINHVAMVHSPVLQPIHFYPAGIAGNRYDAYSHNGEINTLRGNINWMRAQEGMIDGSVFGDSLSAAFSKRRARLLRLGSFDNMLEFLLMSGRWLRSRHDDDS